MGAHSALTVNEELGSLQLAGNTLWSLPAHHGLPVLPGPGDLWQGRSLHMAQQAHTVPNLDLHVAQGLRKVRSSWRREQQRKGLGRFSFPTAEPGEGMGLQNQRARCPDELQD